MAGQVLDTVADLRTSVMIAKAYGNTEGAAIAQAKLDAALKGAPSYVTSSFGDIVAPGTRQFAGHVSGASGLDDLPSDIDAWTKNDFTRFQSAVGKKAPVKAAAGKVDPSRTFKTSDKDTRSETAALKARVDDDRESFAEKIQKEAKAFADKAADTGKSIAEVAREKAPSSKAKTETEKAAAEGDPRAGMYNKGGLMKKKSKK